MRYQGAGPAVAELSAAVSARLPELTRSTFDQIIEEMQVYRAGRFVSRDELWASCRDHLRMLVRALREAGPPDLVKVRAVGRDRARQGVPLPELLRAFRIGFAEVWHAFADLVAGKDRDALATLVAATTALWDLLDDYIEELTNAYRETLAEAARAQQNKRMALMEALFAGGAATEGTLWDIARMLELPLDGTFLVVAAETPGLGQEALPRIESRLREHHHASAWRLTPDLQAGVVSLRESGATEAVLALLRESASGRVGVSPVFQGLGNTARALHLARIALSSVVPGTPVVIQFNESPLAGLVASDPEASVQLADQILRPILELPREEGDVLLETLRTWFDCHGSTKLTAERVFCHPNTVRHRLKRVTDELGRSLTDPADIAELGTALRALAIFGEGARS